ncbi:MAG: protein-methionine-sulfoxide reductase catalytic subunit MsrP [Gemmatimonas sp.]
MLIRIPRSWELPEAAATPEPVWRARRALLKGLAAGPILAAMPGLVACDDKANSQEGSKNTAKAADGDPTADLYPAKRNDRFTVDRPITDEKNATTYNNFYEYGIDKDIVAAAQQLKTRPWAVEISGLVEKPQTVDIDALIRQMPLEERVYRHRCVEAWSMTVPWSGFPLASLVKFAAPLSSAKYIRFETFSDSSMAPGLRAPWFPWPYVEGLTMAEATNELAFVSTGLYGKPILKQNGAPLRLTVPWKYGFKSVKSIVKIAFVEERPKTFWEVAGPSEYGFWANVNPQVPHPRWSQASERVLGTNERVATQLFNGYGEQVAGLYKGLDGERLYM